jgi:uncharacterized protein YuzE
MSGALPYPSTTAMAMKLIERTIEEQLQLAVSKHWHRRLPAEMARQKLESLAQRDPAMVLELLLLPDYAAHPMKVTYDDSVDAAYVYLTDETPVARTLAVAHEGINLDFAANGILVGIEVLEASRRLPVKLLVFSDQEKPVQRT